MQKNGSLSVADVMPVAEFRAALRGFLRTTEQVARTNGLTPQRYLLLLLIKGSPSGTGRSTVTELSEQLRLAQSTVTELVKRAEDAGLVRRERSDVDARVAHLELTPEGERRLGRSLDRLGDERHHLREMLAALERDGNPA